MCNPFTCIPYTLKMKKQPSHFNNPESQQSHVFYICFKDNMKPLEQAFLPTVRKSTGREGKRLTFLKYASAKYIIF